MSEQLWRDLCGDAALRVLELTDRMSMRLSTAFLDQADPDMLDVLYGLDALTCQTRRHVENLQVLSGHHPPDPDRQVTSLSDLIYAALGRISGWKLVTVGRVDAAAVAESVSGDLIRVLSELLDNATRYTPPERPITAAGHWLHDGGVLLRVEDLGIGMAEADLARYNALLRGHLDAVTPAPGAVPQGLRVIAHVAGAHGLQVSLHRRPPQGTSASVYVPAELVVELPADPVLGNPEWSVPAGPDRDRRQSLAAPDRTSPLWTSPTAAFGQPGSLLNGLPLRDPQPVRANYPTPASSHRSEPAGPDGPASYDDLAAFDAATDGTPWEDPTHDHR